MPAIAAVIFGLYGLFKLGFDLGQFSSTYLLIFGGLVSMWCTAIYTSVVFYPPDRRSWVLTFGALGAFVPYVFSLYLIGSLGFWAGWRAIYMRLGFGHLVVAAFWIFSGLAMLHGLSKIKRSAQNFR